MFHSILEAVDSPVSEAESSQLLQQTTQLNERVEEVVKQGATATLFPAQRCTTLTIVVVSRHCHCHCQRHGHAVAVMGPMIPGGVCRVNHAGVTIGLSLFGGCMVLSRPLLILLRARAS